MARRSEAEGLRSRLDTTEDDLNKARRDAGEFEQRSGSTEARVQEL